MPDARLLSWSVLTVASPRYVLVSGVPEPNFTNGPIRVHSTKSPFTKPSIDAVPAGPCTSPLTFSPFCCSTHRTERSELVANWKVPSHVPVTSTSGETRLVRSPPAHPRLETASRITVEMKNLLNMDDLSFLLLVGYAVSNAQPPTQNSFQMLRVQRVEELASESDAGEVRWRGRW